jgi:hypothetical protein
MWRKERETLFETPLLSDGVGEAFFMGRIRGFRMQLSDCSNGHRTGRSFSSVDVHTAAGQRT